MSKKTKFKLEKLKVESFLTRLEDEKKGQVKGGCNYTNPVSCPASVGCTNSDNPYMCCVHTPECTGSAFPQACCDVNVDHQ
jgi:hypothetical protein